MKLTNEEIARVFAMYWGCDYVFMTLPHVYKVGMCYTYKLAWESSFKDCKLLLTPLSAISDEHAIEVAKICGLENPRIKRGINLIKIIGHNATLSISYLEMEIHLMANTYNCTNTMDIVSIREYLKSKGYNVPLWFGIDHPCNGMTAIQLNIAIDKTTLT